MIARVIRSINYLSYGVLLFLVGLTTVDVFGRYVFNRPLLGTFEIGELGLVVVVFLGLSYTALHRGHVTIDFFTSRMSAKKQAILDIANSSLGIVIFALIAWRGTVQGLYARQVGESTDLLHIPTYPFRLLVTVGAIMLCIVLITYIIESVGKVKGRS